MGTYNISKLCQENDIRLIYISTDSVFDGEKGYYKEEDIPNPINYYSLTKLLGENFVQMVNNHLIIRTSFISKEYFKYEKALIDQYTSRIFVDDLAKDVVLAMNINLQGIIHIAGERDTLYNIVKKIHPSIGAITIKETGMNLHKDLSLNSSKWERIKKIYEVKTI